ncbi:MAG: uracil-DNA glycosylase [Nitrospinota bacterium]|nr:uracil-DNA glycosylase [Nitrospinota bacterium]
MNAAYSRALRALALRLETLKIHGHDQLSVSCADWKEDMRSKLKKLKSATAQGGARAQGGATAQKRIRSQSGVNTNTKEKVASLPPAAPVKADLTLEDIRVEVADCQKCALAKTRTNTVFGVGDPKARLVFVGEGPGAEEDKQGEPFVGRAGKLLNDMITAMGLKRSDVYIANIVKCRPPGNRDPLPEESAQCMPYLLRQLKVIAPDYICSLGAVSARNLLETTEAIGKLRGRFHDFEGMELLATYHPSYLLRNPGAKPEAWKDLRLLMKKLGLKDPRKNNG